jgi:hypothetical protein
MARLQLHALACNLGNFLRTVATPKPIKDWSLTSLKDKLIKIGKGGEPWPLHRLPDGRGPPTRTALPGSPENRYDAPQSGVDLGNPR